MSPSCLTPIASLLKRRSDNTLQVTPSRRTLHDSSPCCGIETEKREAVFSHALEHEILPTYEDSTCDKKLMKAMEDAIESASADLRKLSLDLWENPETAFEEYHAHKILTAYLEKQGFSVKRSAYGMETAFEASFTASKGRGRTISFCSEYDALPGIGQACGHNLIAISGVAAAIATKKVLEDYGVEGKVILFGTPAEEGGGGKELLVRAGAFKQVDACVMTHPAPLDAAYSNFLAINTYDIEYFGKTAHAAAAPSEAINALDAAVLGINNISAMRQQILPTDRVHGIILEGGKASNVIPDYTKLKYTIRSTTTTELAELRKKFLAAFEAAGPATGCKVKITEVDLPYYDVIDNEPFVQEYTRYMVNHQGKKFPSKQVQKSTPSGSTDMGNVTYVVPGIHPMFSIHTEKGAGNHTIGFTKQAKTEEAHKETLAAAKGLSCVSLRFLTDSAFAKAVKKDFDDEKKRREGRE